METHELVVRRLIFFVTLAMMIGRVVVVTFRCPDWMQIAGSELHLPCLLCPEAAESGPAESGPAATEPVVDCWPGPVLCLSLSFHVPVRVTSYLAFLFVHQLFLDWNILAYLWGKSRTLNKKLGSRLKLQSDLHLMVRTLWSLDQEYMTLNIQDSS